MFLDRSGFKRLLKEAYKGNILCISKKNQKVLIHSGHWMLVVDMSVIPNKTKADIIELIGEWPEDNKPIKAGPDNIQYELDETYSKLWELANKLEMEGDAVKVRETKVLIEDYYNLIQIMKTDDAKSTVFGMKKGLLDIVDIAGILEDKENQCSGPFLVQETNEEKAIYWKNSGGVFIAYQYNIREFSWTEKLLECCSQLDKEGIKK